MQGAMIAIFWSLAGKLGAKFFASVIVSGLKEWSSHTENKFDDAIAEAFKKAWESEPEK